MQAFLPNTLVRASALILMITVYIPSFQDSGVMATIKLSPNQPARPLIFHVPSVDGVFAAGIEGVGSMCGANNEVCGKGCCPKGMECLPDARGCCVPGSSCPDPPASSICLDAIAPDCSPFIRPHASQLCCPMTAPACSSVEGYGAGCFGSATPTPKPSVDSKEKRSEDEPTIIITGPAATITKQVEYNSDKEVTCTPYNLCSVQAWNSGSTYSLTVLCDQTPSPTPTVAQACPTLSLCTAKAWDGTSSYSVTHVCRTPQSAVSAVNVQPSNPGIIAAEVDEEVCEQDPTFSVITETITSTITPESSSPTPSICVPTSTSLTPWGTPVAPTSTAANSTVASIPTGTSTPPAFTGGAAGFSSVSGSLALVTMLFAFLFQ